MDSYPQINRITLNKVFERRNQIHSYRKRRKWPGRVVEKNVLSYNGLKRIFLKINLILRQTNKIVVCQSKIVIANRNSYRKVNC